MVRCDVIVPIYNAFDCVKACVNSVLKNTDFSKAHLILIDDKSPDGRILPLLEEYGKKYPEQITVLKNEKNLGFIGTVNRGMKYSKNDVLLLNSDTEVTKGWLNKIRNCAYSGERIATVTPLSNNATLASVPKLFEANELPEGMSVEEMGKLVEECSMKLYPEIPTAHGFCMYIKREALKVVGYFDEEKFGKGYGEENDFSFRCFDYGYRHLLCDDTYVLHKESQSFQGDKVDHLSILEEAHPELKARLDRWCALRDIELVGANVALALGLRKERPNILLVIHDWRDIERNVGGTTLHVRDIVFGLRKKYNFHVLYPEDGVYKVHSYFKDSDAVTYVSRRVYDIGFIKLYSKTYEEMFEDLLERFKISLVHVHHILNQYFDVGEVCRRNKIEYIVTLHDFYLQYPEVSRLDERVVDNRKFPIKIEVWQEICSQFLKGAKLIIAPSKFTKDRFCGVYKDLKTKTRIIPHGMDIKRVKARKKDVVDSDKNIAFVGAIGPHKASAILKKMADENKTDIKIHLFGETDKEIEESERFMHHGNYQRQDLPKLLKKNKIDLVCAFSIQLETYMYTMDEAIASGLPVLSFDVGGAGVDRVEENGFGWIIKYTDDVETIMGRIEEILEDRDEYNAKVERINQYHIRTIEEMVDEYEKIYDKMTEVKKLDMDKMREGVMRADLTSRMDVMIDRPIIRSFEAEYGNILCSIRWKLMGNIKVPKIVGQIARKIVK